MRKTILGLLAMTLALSACSGGGTNTNGPSAAETEQLQNEIQDLETETQELETLKEELDNSTKALEESLNDL